MQEGTAIVVSPICFNEKRIDAIGLSERNGVACFKFMLIK
jgi:hypothetical protein